MAQEIETETIGWSDRQVVAFMVGFVLTLVAVPAFVMLAVMGS